MFRQGRGRIDHGSRGADYAGVLTAVPVLEKPADPRFLGRERTFAESRWDSDPHCDLSPAVGLCVFLPCDPVWYRERVPESHGSQIGLRRATVVEFRGPLRAHGSARKRYKQPDFDPAVPERHHCLLSHENSLAMKRGSIFRRAFFPK